MSSDPIGAGAAPQTPGTQGGIDLQQVAKDHLWMHFTRHSTYDQSDVPVIVRGEGPYIWDANGKRYLDGLAGLFVVRPAHNPLGPLDFAGVYDERSDRRHTLAELVDRGYEDAYRQFIEPVVGASGDRIEAGPLAR